MSDKRYEIVRHTNLPYDVSYVKSRYTRLELWLERAVELREQVLMSAGLSPMPEKTPLNPVISGRIERDGYTVENVYFESFPGFYVAGNLYRPVGSGPFPGVLNPHGHWKEGRLNDDDMCSVPGRCINFALQGYVAFAYDMVDYVDSKQWEHRRWNLRDRLWGLSTGGLQLWNSIRAIDFLQSLPDVDPSQIACTGASGGGTQTFLLCAVDERVKVSAPVNMISAHMQGGCVCENLPGLRIDTDNVEIAALMAPSPMLMVSATGDWTKDTPQIEYPAVRHIYELFGAEDKLACVQVDAKHNYNRESREAVYSFFGKWLRSEREPSDGAQHSVGAGYDIPPQRVPPEQKVQEQPFVVEKEEDVRVFPDGMPDGALDVDGIVRTWIDASEAQFKAQAQTLYPDHPKALARFAATYRPALERALALPESFDLASEVLSQETDGDISTKRVLIEETNRGARIQAVVVEPTDMIAHKAAVLVDGLGNGSFPESGAVRRLVERGWRVTIIEPAVAPDGTPERDLDKDLFDVYNRTELQERVYEIVAAAHWESRHADRVALIGTGIGGPLCLLAAPFAAGVNDVAVDTCGLDFSDDDVLIRDLYVPCLRRTGDFRTALILCPPRRLIVHGIKEKADWWFWMVPAYLNASCDFRVRIHTMNLNPMQIAEWLCKE